MRRFDKRMNMMKANLLDEQRYLQSKGLIKEEENNNSGLEEIKDLLRSNKFLSDKPMNEEARYNSDMGYSDEIKQIVDEIKSLFEDNQYMIDAELIVKNDMSPDYLDSTEEVERALEHGEISSESVLEMVCGFLENKYDERIEVEPQGDVIYVYEKGNRSEGAALIIKVENNL